MTKGKRYQRSTCWGGSNKMDRRCAQRDVQRGGDTLLARSCNKSKSSIRSERVGRRPQMSYAVYSYSMNQRRLWSTRENTNVHTTRDENDDAARWRRCPMNIAILRICIAESFTSTAIVSDARRGEDVYSRKGCDLERRLR